MKTNKEASDLLDKYNSGTANKSEKLLLERWYLAQKTGDDLPPIDTLLADQQKSKRELMKMAGGGRSTKIWPLLAIAASITVVFFFVLFNLLNEKSITPATLPKQVAKADVAPGGNVATLTLDNGKTIALSQAKAGVVIGASELNYDDGSAVSAMPADKKNTNIVLTTPNGGTYQVKLPDGSMAWLNADSEISFPQSFSGLKQRRVEVRGEVYFEVAKNARQPFKVRTASMDITVLGTHFNVSAYPDDYLTATTLVEGSVQVEAISNGRALSPTLLKPNQQAMVGDGGTIEVAQVDAQETILWKNGKFGFDSEALPSIMKKIQRWYNVDVLMADDMADVVLSGSVSKSVNLSVLLKKLEQTGNIKFEIKDKTVVVSRK